MGVYLPYDNYSAMQGPAPDGFHVPLNTEWQAVYNIRTALGGGSSDGTNFGIALKLPLAGYRSLSSAGVGKQGTDGYYWSSSRSDGNSAYSLTFNSTALNPQGNIRTFGFPVRCFKNFPTVPTSSWTKLYGTSIESGGIFWSSTDGLISLSSDGNTWITIADKNLGATTVWNNGNTLSETNCGKYYQWGNNYGFPFTGSVTTSSTKVDASTYGPGNYYSSSTFITMGNSPYRWDTTDNGNLWGGVTGVNPMSELKNAYIGEYAEPGIFHNATLGLISLSSNGSTRYTIADKNLGATQVWNSGDTLSEANCGKYYQWGNNYGFPFSGGISISSVQVNAYRYGPGNYYSSSTFIVRPSSPYGWDSSNNTNLRGYTNGTLEGKRGPCPIGYHVQNNQEWDAIVSAWTALGGGASDGDGFCSVFKLPFPGKRNFDNGYVYDKGTKGYYWTNYPSGGDNSGYISFNSSTIASRSNRPRTCGFSIRPFKNEAVKPDESRTKLY